MRDFNLSSLKAYWGRAAGATWLIQASRRVVISVKKNVLIPRYHLRVTRLFRGYRYIFKNFNWVRFSFFNLTYSSVSVLLITKGTMSRCWYFFGTFLCLLKIDTATFEVNMTNHSQDATEKTVSTLFNFSIT